MADDYEPLEPVELRNPYRRELSPPPRRFRGRFIIAIVLIVAVGGYFLLRHSSGNGPVPLIKAQLTPYKVKPQDPGGAEPPPDSEELEGDTQPQAGNAGNAVEQLAPPPEAPLAHPTAGQPATPTTPAAPGQPPAAPAGNSQGAAAPPDGSGMPAVPVAPVTTAETATPGTPSTPSPAPPVAAPSTPAPSAAAPAAPAAGLTAPAPKPQRLAALPPASSMPKPHIPREQEWRIQLGSLPTATAAEIEWLRIKTSHAALLGRLVLNIRRVDLGQGRGVYFRIQAGPVAGHEAAATLCTQLTSAGVPCMAVKR
jgi:hypothetical protein